MVDMITAKQRLKAKTKRELDWPHVQAFSTNKHVRQPESASQRMQAREPLSASRARCRHW